MKLIIAGGRDFSNWKVLVGNVMQFQDETVSITEIVCGEAKGADLLGRKLAEQSSCPIASFPADWNKHGKSAGYKRNVEMAKYADALIAFWDGESRGTAHMIETASNQGLLVKVIRY